jgi:uncharacterized protein
MPRTGTDCVLMVFAKAPRPGAVKTRLIPALGADGAAELHGALVELALATACAARFDATELHCAPGVDDPFFRACSARHAISLAAQIGDNLGERMHAAFAAALGGAAQAVLIGTDCPALTCGMPVPPSKRATTPCLFRPRTEATR